MSGVATAAVVGGGIQAFGANKAAGAQAGAADDAARAQKPYQKAGLAGLNQLNAMMGIESTMQEKNDWMNEWKNANKETLKGMKKPEKQAALKSYVDQKLAERKANSNYGFLNQRFGADQFVKDPGYDFRLQQGTNTLQNSLAARGGLFSGAAGKALTQYGQDYGSNEYQNAYSRFTGDQTNMYNRAANMAGMGQTANANAADYNMQGANARAAGYQGMASGFGNALGGGISGASSYWGNQASGNPINVSAKNTTGLFPVQ